MSRFVRWILAIAFAVVLIFIIIGSDSCDQIGGGASTFLLVASPAVMALGVIAAAILFGLNKRWRLWLSLLAMGGALGICGYVSWFVLISQWCG